MNNKDNINRIDHLNDPKTPCLSMRSEMKENFENPKLKKPSLTRANRLEKFLWHEFYDEYVRSKQRLEAMQPGTPNSTYYDEFGKPAAHLEEKAKELEISGLELRNIYPLYSTMAISVWNPDGDFRRQFRRVFSVSLPTHLQRGQFDD